ncbi:MAG: hypothetical protein RBT20_00450 [Syntrophales bacterium]|jgi:hypothetical protein|nr:hypothetical protein [Syntrophales bacterium]
MLRYNLFTYRDLWIWVDQPFEPPPITVMQELDLELDGIVTEDERKEAT